MNFPLPLIRQLALTLWYADDTTLRAESKEELKSFLMKVQEDEWKSWLKTQHCKNKDHGIWPHHFMANRWGKVLTVTDIYFLGLQNHCRLWLQPCNSKMLAPWKKSYGKPRQCTKKQRHHIADKDPYSQSYYFSSSHVWKWELDHKESWAPKNWCFQTVMLEKTLDSPLDSKEIKPVNPKGNQPWIFIGKDPVALRLVQGTLKSLLQHHNSETSILWCTAFIMVQLSYPYMTTGKKQFFWTFVGKVISLLFSTLSRFAIAFLPRSKHLLISWL